MVDCLDRTAVAPDRICFEVTENSVITNIDHARRFIGVLHGMGCQFALDDFGRGLSSFANLKNLQLDYLKIDGYFIRNLAVDTVNQAMVTAMIKLARSLNFRVIAEHVEDMSALDSARRAWRGLRAGLPGGSPAAVVARELNAYLWPIAGLHVYPVSRAAASRSTRRASRPPASSTIASGWSSRRTGAS